MSVNKKMGDAHEAFLVDLFDGTQHRGSGNQWANPIDGEQSRKHVEYAFSWDGKSTLGKSVGVSLEMWDKARLQAGGNRPMLGLRWYATEKLEIRRDLVVVDANDMAEVLDAANQVAELKALLQHVRARLVQSMEQDASKVRYFGEAAALCVEIEEGLGQ